MTNFIKLKKWNSNKTITINSTFIESIEEFRDAEIPYTAIGTIVTNSSYLVQETEKEIFDLIEKAKYFKTFTYDDKNNEVK
jgi:uncharacterized protein YlzI (FlbEa/FlbD family)